MHIAVISSFPPVASGIATFTHHMLRALKTVDPTCSFLRIPVIAPSDPQNQDKISHITPIRRDVREDYIAAGKMINSAGCDALLIEHEFGQFGGNLGSFILETIQHTRIPIFLVAHTVPSGEDARHREEKGEFFDTIAHRIHGVAVFSPQAKTWLATRGFPEDTIAVIPHAVPDFEQILDKDILRRELDLPLDRPIVFGFGFVHPDKGTLYAVQAMNAVRRTGNNSLLVYAGTALPEKPESVACVSDIRKEIVSHNLEDSVLFIESFISDAKVAAYIGACDIGIVPYAYKSYTASGPLSFLIGAAKPIIVTPFTYAEATLTRDEALFVPFKDSDAIAQGILHVTQDTVFRQTIQKNIEKKRATLTWNVIGQAYMEFFARRLGTFRL